MGNLDHIQRGDADKRGCHNCAFSSTKFKDWPCCACKGNNDRYIRDYTKPETMTGKDFGYK